jgi:hypothetical protein
MNLNTLEKIARQVLNGKASSTVNIRMTSAEQRAMASQTWQITNGGAAAGTLGATQPLRAWG